MIKLPYGLIAGGVGLLAILLGWFVTWQRLEVAQANVEASVEREARAVQITFDCQANRTAIEERLDEVAEDINKLATKEARMQGAIDAASIRTREIAKARAALERLEAEHEDLVARAVPLDACQTYEIVLAAIAGDSHEQ
jgi:hypothetical protein